MEYLLSTIRQGVDLQVIKIVRGDLMLATEDILGHQVNCQAVMNSGVAKSIREQFPEAYDAYMDFALPYKRMNIQSDLLGEAHFVVLENKTIANLFGQLNYGYDGAKYTSESALFTCFKQLRRFAEERNKSVALPYMIGGYRGGGDWKLIEDHLLTAFDGYEVTLYKMHKG